VRYIVTGRRAGFIGSQLAGALVEAGPTGDVVGVDCFTTPTIRAEEGMRTRQVGIEVRRLDLAEDSHSNSDGGRRCLPTSGPQRGRACGASGRRVSRS